ncbi:hypothetical protein [Hymenobacter sp. BT491]|uniref:hypothetical protein n=1 Tax=Hymenobacter sp. BT491 TaxID=2766779 RepID=UPI001653D0AC|nr:hypothetical protein [Hymenobacter sp. BT491]MBC6992365.1 hypothetical protein [Hymenobacter sp. BT491]
MFETGKAGRYEVSGQPEGYNPDPSLAAQRHEELLVVSFTGPAEHRPAHGRFPATTGRQPAR